VREARWWCRSPAARAVAGEDGAAVADEDDAGGVEPTPEDRRLVPVAIAPKVLPPSLERSATPRRPTAQISSPRPATARRSVVTPLATNAKGPPSLRRMVPPAPTAIASVPWA